MIGVIAGGTGLVGELVVNRLLADSNYGRVISVSRSPLGIEHPKLTEVLIADLSHLPEVHDQLAGDAYFCCLGTTRKAADSKENFRKIDFVGVVNFARIAKAHEAKSFSLVSARGADPDSLIFYNKVKGETEEAVRELGIRSVIIYRPGLLMGERKESRRRKIRPERGAKFTRNTEKTNGWIDNRREAFGRENGRTGNASRTRYNDRRSLRNYLNL